MNKRHDDIRWLCLLSHYFQNTFIKISYYLSVKFRFTHNIMYREYGTYHKNDVKGSVIKLAFSMIGERGFQS